MNLNKPKFWDKQIGIVSILLLPLSLVFILLSFLKKKLTKQFIFKIPIICIGNIYIGGTGKTPTCILLANELFKLGRKPVIIRKFYKSHNDEYGLIKIDDEIITYTERDNNTIKGCIRGFSGISKYRDENSETTIKWNDKKINIKWPIKKPILSDKDKNGINFVDFK